MFRVFDEAFFAALDREARRLDYDVVVFLSAGYYLTYKASKYSVPQNFAYSTVKYMVSGGKIVSVKKGTYSPPGFLPI